MLKSSVTIEYENTEQYWRIIQRLEPEFYLLRFAIKQYNVNPMIMPRVIRAIANMAAGTRYGKITLYMQDGVITTVEGTEHDKVNEPSIVGGEENEKV